MNTLAVASIMSDRDPQFTSAFNQSLAQRLGVSWALCTAPRPETDGQTERTDHTLQAVLRHCILPTMHDWDKHPTLVQAAIKNSWHETVQETPYFLIFGRHFKTPFTMGRPSWQLPVISPAAGELAAEMQTLTARAKRYMFAAQQRMKHYYGSGRSESCFEVGELLLLSTAGIKMKVASVGTEKLLPEWIGPFK